MSGGLETKENIESFIEKIDNINFTFFKNIYIFIFNKITSINLKIAGNINISLVQELYNYLTMKIKLFSKQDYIETCEKKELIQEENIQKEENKNYNSSNDDKSNTNNSQKDFSYIIDYFQKSNMQNELDGAIFIIYRFEDKFKDYMDVLKGCLENIAKIQLRFELSHAIILIYILKIIL